jgi:tripartite-type tricarboxylate transporter receptor subunit TctC
MMFAPAATPKPVVALLSAQVRTLIADPSLKQRFASIGYEATPLSADEVTALMRKIEADLTPVIKRLNIKLD